MIITVVENVRGYFGSRPPLVVFMIFLGSMAVGLVTFAYFVSDMPKAVVDQDFKTFMDRLSVLSFCLGEERGGMAPGNASQSSLMGMQGRMGFVERMKRSDAPMVRDRNGEQASPLTTIPPSPAAAIGNFVVNVTMTMDVEIATPPSSTPFHNHSVISASVWASQLRRVGQGQDVEANVTMVLYPFGYRAHPCQNGRPGRCYTVSACITLTAPRHFFPHTLRPDLVTYCHGESMMEGENHLHGEVVMDQQRCTNASFVRLHHLYSSDNQGVVAMDRSAMNLHLMHSSYFLFVMVISLFCYAIIKGRPAKVKIIHTQGSSDKHSLIQA